MASQSTDISACDFFLWGYLKSQVFKAPAPHTVQELKHRFQQEVKRIPMEMLQSNGRLSQETYRVPKAEWWSSE
jgi:hypothetical protein